MACGATVWFAKPDALKGTLVDTLQEVRPTMFLGVPRVWEKIQDKMEMQMSEMKGFKRALTKWAQVNIKLKIFNIIEQPSIVPAVFGFASAKFLGFKETLVILSFI